MRRSVEQGDRGWNVWLDGVLQKDVVMADDGKGEVERFVRNDEGRLIIDGDDLRTETVYGKVEIRRADEPTGAPKPANVTGLVAPVWSDSGEAPVGDVTYTYSDGPLIQFTGELPVNQWMSVTLVYKDGVASWSVAPCDMPSPWATKPSNPNAKPSLPALTRESGNRRGPGWCDE